MSNGKNYTNPEFIEAFQRVKEILIDLKDRIMPVKQGNAVNFRKNINDAIGTIPETNQETGAITKDGYGMSGAVFAMGEAVEKGLDNMDTALVQFTNDANDKFDTFTEEKNTALNDFNIYAEEALQKVNNATTKANEAVTNAETALGNANTAVTNANTAVTNANAVIGSANQIIDQAEDVVQAAQQAANEAATAANQAIEKTNEAKEALDNLQVNIDTKTKEAMEQATADANTAANRANSAAEKITNTFVCLAQGNSETDKYAANSYPVTVDEHGNETKITQSHGAVWFQIVSEVNTSTEGTENPENTETV